MTDARDTILRKVREALRDIPEGEKPADVPIPRDYRLTDSAPREELVVRFVERVAEYKARVREVEASELAGAIEETCRARGVRSLVVPDGIPDSWIPRGIIALCDSMLTNEQLDGSDGVLTTCALGIAQTGTIVLDRGEGQGRRALTLVPDFHLCIVREDQIVGIVPEAVRLLEKSADLPGRPMTWISGPSATSDIELNRVEGVHGPRTLEVLVVKS